MELKQLRLDRQTYWVIERARLGSTRDVPVEVVVNGHPVAKRNIASDGRLREISFDVQIPRSSWIALRILPSSHSNPIFILVGDEPIRVKRSIEWCLKSVDQCWSQKERFIKTEELAEAKAAYEHARQTYRSGLRERGAE